MWFGKEGCERHFAGGGFDNSKAGWKCFKKGGLDKRWGGDKGRGGCIPQRNYGLGHTIKTNSIKHLTVDPDICSILSF